MKEKHEIKGKVKLILKDKRGKIVDQKVADNLIVDTGRELVSKRFVGQADPVSHIAVGTGATEPKAEDTALGNEIFRKAISPIDPAEDFDGPTVSIKVDFDYNEANGEANSAPLTEAGIFDSDGTDSENDTMYNRVTFPVINKTDNFTLSLIWEITF